MGKFEVNSHAHIFNFGSVFTENSVKILLDRIKELILPDLKGEVQDALVRKIRDLLMPVVKGASKEVDPRTHLIRWVKDLEVDTKFNKLLEAKWPDGSTQLEIINAEALAELAVNALVDFLRKIWVHVAKQDDASRVTLSDLIDFLYIGLQPSIAEVTAMLLEQSPPDSGIVALTMDVGGNSERDRDVIIRQFRDTSDQVLYYPGRVFPFAAVDPRRQGHLENMERALQHQGFVGVKIYPSLGFDISDGDKPNPKVKKICERCIEMDAPIMVHCSKGGFYRDKGDIVRGYPPLWEPLLKLLPGLKVCFGHFGGGHDLMTRPMKDDAEAANMERNWAMAILGLMEKYPGVYTDISFNTDPMLANDADGAKNYIDNLIEYLRHPVYQHRILFGTDFFLVRVVARDDSFHDYFQEKLNGAGGVFDRMAVRNSAAYLGLPGGSGEMGENIKRYRDFVVNNHYKCRSEPAPWLMGAIAALDGPLPEFNYTRFGSRWTPNNQAHLWLYTVLCRKKEISNCKGLSRFAEHGEMLLSSMSSQSGGFLSSKDVQSAAENRADYIDLQFSAKRRQGNKATYEPGYNSGKAVREMTDLIMKPGAKVMDLAVLVDMIYRFPAEVGV